jgi:hypothetical protein
VCTVRRDVCRKLNNKSVIFFRQILFIMPVLKLSRRTVYVHTGIHTYIPVDIHTGIHTYMHT